MLTSEFQAPAREAGRLEDEGEVVEVSLEEDTPRKWTGPEKWQVWLAGVGLLVTIATGVVQLAR